ncbi:hypothetical protein JMUB3935_2333 [Leptotrichia trevisanii]|uniref:Uncharacterized protein n=1 Tax=Leptotrichia trevisanii TaxID=109328 RepID=A0A510KNT9_9FUSO|nr:hypothetical protein [Leptotrichia trevisanii]BBM53346.1 hypothetical protein JMUB3935_2333 [Leptotrichia trevisanii]
MFLIFWIACIYFYVRVIRFSLKEIPKIKEYRKTMSKKEAKKKIKSERTKRDKLDSVLAVVFLFLAVASSPNSGNKTETAEKKEVKKAEAKKEEVKKEEPKAEAKTTEVEADPYKEIEANIKRKFPKTRKIVATDVGVILEIQAKGGFNKNMMVKEMFRDARKYINEINKQYKMRNLKYESMALQFFYPMSDGETSGNMKILQLDVDNDMIEVGFVMPAIAEEVKQNFK